MIRISVSPQWYIFIPISVIGIWRWSYWLARKVAAGLYEPSDAVWPADKPEPTVSVVTPVYNEDPVLFEQAMQSWIANGVTEIVAVIDHSNTHDIVNYERHYRDNKKLKTKCRLIVTRKPGKRAALCDGIAAATGDFIALVDSDTVWGPNVRQKALPYFLNEKIGGVSVPQRIQNPDSVSNVLFDMLLWTRYREEIPFLLTVGHVFNTLSGRTAIYRREALLNPKYDNLHALRHEFFLGTRGVSGDDKRLTHLILEQGWLVDFVSGAVVYTSGLGKLGEFMKQRLRWTRNSWRADLRAVSSGWVWQHPTLALFMTDRFIQPFFMLIGPLVFAIAIYKHLWIVVVSFLVWWMLSRFVRLFSYFKNYPKRLIYLPAWIVYTYASALIKIYALGTLIENSWATRWTKSKMRFGFKAVRGYLTIAIGASVTILVLSGLNAFIGYSRTQAASDVGIPVGVNTGAFNKQIDFSADTPPQPALPQNATLPTGVRSYVIRTGDTLPSIAYSLGVNLQSLKDINSISSSNQLVPGNTLVYFPPTTQ